MITLVASEVVFYSQNDETAFFQWLERIEAVESVKGVGVDIEIVLRPLPREECIRDIIALFYRYRVGMTQIQKLLSDESAVWLKNPKMYWYDLIFGQPGANV